MKILLGVDTNRTYKAAFDMCKRLQFTDASLTLTHAVEAPLTLPGFGSIAETAQAIEFAKLAREAGQIALDRAVKDEGDVGQVLLSGNAAEAMMRYADENAIELIVVHSERKGRLGSFFLGSVSRGLAISAKQSVLITKGAVSSSGPVSAVMAIDHSPYSQCALERFLEMAPAGLKHIHVLTSVHLGPGDPYYSTSHQAPVEKKLVGQARNKVRSVVEELTRAGYVASGDAYNLPVDEAISRGMTNAGADLLILGAQGHGFLHRLTLGSTALHQVVVSPYSVLILRPTG